MEDFEDLKRKKRREKLAVVSFVTFLEGMFVYIATLIFMGVFLGDVQLDWFISIVWAYMITTFIMTYRNYEELEARIDSVNKDNED